MAYRPQGAQIKATKAFGWYKEAKGYLSSPLKGARKDCRYYDNEQWTKDELYELEERGQPALVINAIKPAIDLVLGTETRARADYKAFPRSDLHVKDAHVVTNLLKQVMDQSNGEYVHSEAFTSLTKAGWAFVEVCKNEDPFGDPVKLRIVPREHMFWDPHAREYDLNDGKYMGRVKWLDLEDAQAKFPEWKEELKRAVDEKELDTLEQPYEMTGDEIDPHGSILDWEAKGRISKGDWIDRGRKRVKLLEVWYKVPVRTMILENRQTGEKEEFNTHSPGALDKFMDPNMKVAEGTIQKVRLAIIAGPNILEDNWSPYRHNRYPFVPYWGFRKDENLEPYSLIRQMISPQDEVNKRRSKALHILNSCRVITDKDAVKDHDELKSEVSRPDAYIVLDNPEARFDVEKETNLAEAQFKLMQEAKEEINRPVPLELLGHETNAQSGKAIGLRQASGHTMLATIFDNYMRSRQLVGSLLFACIQQFYTVPHVVRIVDQGGEFDFITINEEITDQETGQVFVRNDIARARVDIKIDEQAYHESIRQAIMEQMMELVTKLPPQISLMLLDLVVSYTDLPGREELVRRIQAIQQSMMGATAPTTGAEAAMAG